MIPQQIAGRDLGNSVALHDALGLSALSGTRWTKQHNGTNTTRGFLRHRLGKRLPTSISPACVVERQGAATPSHNVCHPEASVFCSSKDLGALRDQSRVFARL